MGKPLVFQFGGADLPFSLEKVDRTRLYGFIDVEAVDGQGRKCELATLADDGRTLVGRGGSAFGFLSPDGTWLERSELKPVDPAGKPITPVPSSFAAPVPLGKTAPIDEYLSHNIKSVYLLRSEGDAGPLAQELKKGSIFTFPYSFRGGLEADVGFLLADREGRLYLAVGQPTRLRFVGLEQSSALTEDAPSEEVAEETLDFGMM